MRVQAGRIAPPKARKPATPTPGPGQYDRQRDLDGPDRTRPHATMGLPHSQKRANVAPAPVVHASPATPLRRSGPSLWQGRRQASTKDVTPGPGQYHVCDSTFCACTGCEGISQGKTIGGRPAVYTGCIPQAEQPGPASYHVDCTTIAAATRYEDCHEPRTHS